MTPTNIKVEATSAGRVVNNSKVDIDKICEAKFGERWSKYRQRWKAAGEMENLEDFPIFVRFETQFKCNSNCITCVHGHKDLYAEHYYNEYLPDDVFKRLVDECAEHGCPSIGMSQINEPLLDPDFIERTQYVVNKGIMDVHVNTNGQLLTADISRKILDIGVTRLCVSLDATTEDTFKKIRRGLDFSTVLRNLEAFLELKNKYNYTLPVVRVSFLLLDANKHELEAFRNYWVDKVDYVSVQRYVPISPFENDARAHAIREAPIRGEQRCSYPYESLFVHGDGTVVPCAAHRARHISVGNIHDSSLHAIWHSDAMQRLREAHKSGDLRATTLCSSCLF